MSGQGTTTVYPLKDASGRLVAEHVREDGPEGKQVRWRRPDGTWGLNGTRLEELPLYGAERLADWPEEYPVILVEGEKAADALNSAGRICAVATVTGASATPGAEALEVLRNREVILWPDGDAPGRSHIERVAERLDGIAAAVNIYTWHEAPDDVKGPDAADHPAVIAGDEKGLGVLLNDLLGSPRWEPAGGQLPPGTNGHGRPQPPAGFNLTDLGNAERLTARHGEDLRHVPAWGRWLVYDGIRWRVDDTGEVERRAKEAVRSIYGEAEDAPDQAARKELARHAMRSEARGRIEAMIALAQSEEGIPARVEDLDADPWIINAQNGAVDLRTGDLRPHRREDLVTKLAPVEYDPDAEAPTWEAFLERVLPSEPLRRFLQRSIGYALTGDVSEQVLLFLHGAGANGKSTLINAVLAMLGDYGQQAAPELLTVKGGAHPTELADLFGARFVASVEVEDGRRLAESLTKQLTGGDRIKARYMRQDFFEFDPTHKVFLAANHKPVVRGTDHAIWRRIKMIPFDVTIPKEEQDPRLPEHLHAELPGILRWAVEGCLAWRREGLGEPEEVRAATAEYRVEMDVIAAYVDECCVVRPEAWSRFADLYSTYVEWCKESGEAAENKRRFGNRLTERGFTAGNGAKNVAIRHGIALEATASPRTSAARGAAGLTNPAPKTAPRAPASPRVRAQRPPPTEAG